MHVPSNGRIDGNLRNFFPGSRDRLELAHSQAQQVARHPGRWLEASPHGTTEKRPLFADFRVRQGDGSSWMLDSQVEGSLELWFIETWKQPAGLGRLEVSGQRPLVEPDGTPEQALCLCLYCAPEVERQLGAKSFSWRPV